MMKFIESKNCWIFLLAWILMNNSLNVSGTLNETVTSSNTTCVHQEKSEKQKFLKSPLVMTAKFEKFDVYETNSGSMRVVQTAVFVAEKIHKGRFSFADTNGTVNLLLYKGMDKLSRRQLCLTEKLLYENQSYVLFLNDSQANRTVVWNATFVPERLPNRKLQKVIFENKLSINMDDLVAPYFEVVVNTDGSESQNPKKAEVLIGDPLFFRCAVNGEASQDPQLWWLHEGAQIENADDKLIETNLKQLTSTLKIARFEPNHRGQYECSVKDKGGIRKRAKIKIGVKAGNYTTMFNEELCGSNIGDYCKHNGICLKHKSSGFVSCKCPQQYYGEKCEFKYSGVVSESIAKTECHNTMIAVSCMAALAIVSLFICLLFIMRHKSKKHRKSDENITNINKNDFVYIPRTISNGQPQFIVRSEEMNKLLPATSHYSVCTNCGREYDRNVKLSSNLSLQMPETHLRLSNSSNFPRSTSDLPKSASAMPSDPTCVLCMVESKTSSLPGFLKVSDSDSRSTQKSPQYVASLPKKARHLGQSDEDKFLQLPVRSASSPVTPAGSSRKIHDSKHQNDDVMQITELDTSPIKLNRSRTDVAHNRTSDQSNGSNRSFTERNEVIV